MPRLSVHMTVYNRESTVALAIRSTLRALSADAELVVIDDGSSDATAAVLDSMTGPRLRRLAGHQRIGYAAARRRLIDETDSDFVAIMDSDDVCLPWRFATQLPALAQGADLVVSPQVTFRTAPFRLRPAAPWPMPPNAVPLHLALGNVFCHPTLVVRRSVLERVGGYRDVATEDYDLYLRAVDMGFRMRRTAVPVLAYRSHGDQVTNSAGFARLAGSEDAFARAHADLRRHLLRLEDPYDDDAVARALARETTARRLGPVQRRLLDRHMRLVLGHGLGRREPR